MAVDARSGNPGWTTFLLVSLYLVARFLWRVVLPGGGWPVPPWHYISMAFDVALLVSLIALRRNQADLDESRRSTATLLFWFGLIAGVGSLLIRLTSEAAWWTGHLMNSA